MLGCVIIAVAAAWVLHRRRVDRAVVALVVAGLVLDAAYLSYTGWIERNPDSWAHMSYARWLSTHHALPRADDCSECHHPPAFYVLAATVLSLCERAKVDAGLGLQLFALSLWAVFLVSAGLLVQRMVRGRLARAMAIALIAFWPYGVMQSVRVNNDTMVCALAGLLLLALAEWWSTGKGLWRAVVLVALGLATKASAISFALVLVLVVLARGRVRRSVRALSALALVLALFAVHRRSIQNTLGGAWRTTALADRSARYCLSFDPVSFVERPFVVARRYKTDEPSYGNQMLKSSLFGLRNTPLILLGPESAPNATLARALNAVLLVLTALTALAALRRSPWRRFLLVTTVGFAVTALGFYVIVPYTFHADFRFVLPVMIPLAILFARRSKLRAVVTLAFVGLSIAAFVPATWTARPVRSSVPLPR